MSGIEERLARDIAAVTGDVPVTDSDLREARYALDGRLASRRQRDRRRTGVAAGVAAAVLVPALGFTAFQALGGEDGAPQPANPGPSLNDPDADFLTGITPTPQLVSGVWRVDNGTLVMLFGADGTVRFDDQGRLFSDPAVTGRYVLDGDRITTTIVDGRRECIGQELAMRVSLPEPGAMHVVHSRPAMSGCVPASDQSWVLEQMLPTRSEFLRTFPVPAKGDWQPLRGRQDLHGVWMAEVTDPMVLANGGGHVLEIAPDGGYTVAGRAGVVVDRGRWNLSESPTRLSLVSADDSPTCNQGDTLVLGEVQTLATGTMLLRATVEQDDCGGDWAELEWILIPQEGREATP